jgi:kumamolisin
MKLHTRIRHRHFRNDVAGTSYTPTQLAAYYGLGSRTAGTGKSVAVIELGGAFSQKDLDAYFKSLGLSVKPVVFHSVQGAQNTPDPDADAEVMLDLCVAGGVAPGVQLHCYAAPNTDAGFLAAINQAIADKVDAISISWGAPEDQWDPAVTKAFDASFARAAAAGITVAAAAGDNGSGDGESGTHVDFPASSPNVVGCGGTSLPSLTSPETVWNDGTAGGATGGGVSGVFALPTFQGKASVPGGRWRGVPDLAGCADPYTGWKIVVDGSPMVVGGTSAVAPLVAAVAAALSASLGRNVGALGQQAYSMPAGCFRDVTSGNNGVYVARAGFDCCCGLGTPVFGKILAALGASPTPVPAPTPTPSTRTIVVVGASSVTVDGRSV